MPKGWLIISAMTDHNHQTETKTVDGIRRTKIYIRSFDGSLVNLIEKYEVLATGYEQVTVRDQNCHPTMWYDTKGDVEMFEWTQVPDKKGTLKWESRIFHSTIQKIVDGKKIR